MRKGAILAFAFSAAIVLTVTAAAQPPGGDKNDKGGPGGKGGFGGPGGKGGFGGFGGQGGKGGFGMRPQPGVIMPPFIQDRLKLSDEQKKAIADLQKEVDSKLEKMLTADQRAELKKMKEGGPGAGGFPGGPGRPGGFGGFP
ncbi:MAG TPA: hypothetical protein VGL71_06905, partial [Urbifossiella sp.]